MGQLRPRNQRKRAFPTLSGSIAKDRMSAVKAQNSPRSHTGGFTLASSVFFSSYSFSIISIPFLPVAASPREKGHAYSPPLTPLPTEKLLELTSADHLVAEPVCLRSLLSVAENVVIAALLASFVIDDRVWKAVWAIFLIEHVTTRRLFELLDIEIKYPAALYRKVPYIEPNQSPRC